MGYATAKAKALAAGAIALTLMQSVPARADDIRIGVLAPDSGTLASFGEQAEIAAAAFAADRDVSIVHAPESCDDDSDGTDAASALTEAAVDVVIGIFCAETVAGAMPVLAASGIPTITVSLRSEIVMQDALAREWPLYRLAPPDDAEGTFIAETIADRWAGEPFALIDDGTIYGRDLVEEIRLDLQAAGIEPSFTDTFRPAEELQFGLVRRLAGAGVTHVFVGGDRSDIAIMARDAGEAELDLTFMGGDAMFAADADVALADGVLAVVARRPGDLADDGSPRAARAIAAIEDELQRRERPDVSPRDGYMLALYAAASIATEAKSRAAGEAPARLADALAESGFETALGPVRFGRDQAADIPAYRLMVARGGDLVPLDAARGLDGSEERPGQ